MPVIFPVARHRTGRVCNPDYSRTSSRFCCNGSALSPQPLPATPVVRQHVYPPLMVVPQPMLYPGPVYYPQQIPTGVVQQRAPVAAYNAQDLQQIEEMFPDMDREVVRSVLESRGGDKMAAINHLLQMSADN